MAVTVNMPQLGETVTEGTILSWEKQPGDAIAEDEVLLEISTDKVDTEVPSPVAGVIREILVPEGETVSVGTPLVVIAEPGEEGEAEAAAAAAPEADETVTAAEGEDRTTETDEEPEGAAVEAVEAGAGEAEGPAAGEPEAKAAPASMGEPEADEDAPRRGILSPVVRKLASEYGLDLDAIPGSGAGGRITRKDVMNYIESGEAEAPAARVTLEPAPEPAPAAQPQPRSEPAAEPEPAVEREPAVEPAPAAEPEPAVEPAAAAEPAPTGDDEVVEITRLRRTIAENMIRSKQTAAHVWTAVEVDFENVERVRRAHRADFKQREGFSLTYLPFISRAAIDALRAHPVVNSSLDLERGTATFHGSIHLGIAIDLNERGLIVTTIRDADQLRMTGLAREVRRLATKTRAGKIELDDITGSTFTITNPGPFGSFMSAPVINVPNVAILSTDTVEKRPTVVTLPDGSDAIAIHHIGYLGLTWDHRAFDGSTAVLFLNRIKENLESWEWEQELS